MLRKHIPKFGSLASYGIIYTITSSVQKGIGFIVFMFFANLLTTTEYAKFGLNYSIFTIICALTYSGILEAVVSLIREHKEEERLMSLYKGANSVFVLLTIFSCLITTIFVVVFYRNNFDHISDFVYILLGAGLSSFFVFQSIIIRLEEKHLLSIILSFVPAIAGYLFGYIAVLYLKSGSSYFLGTFLGVIVSMVILVPFTRKGFNGFTLKKKDIYLISSRITPYIVIAVLAWILGYGNTFLIKYLFSDLQVAIFVFLFTISSIIQLVANSMNQVWSPRFFLSFEKESIEVLEDQYSKFTKIQGLILGLTGAGIIIVAPFILNYFHKLSKFNHTSLEMFFLFLGYIVSISWWHNQNYFMISNKGKALMNLTLISGIIGYGLWVVCMVVMGPIGIYAGFFVQMGVKSLIVYYKARTYWKIRFDWSGLIIGTGILIAALLIAQTYN